jgi:thioesterase domain-containing protein
MEIARRLQQNGRQTGPVILADPPALPLHYDRRNHAGDPRQPQIAQQLYQQARNTLLEHASLPYNDTPFDIRDPKQVHHATLAGVGSLIASLTHVPSPFSGSVELIVSAARAPGFFHPQMPWRKLLPGPRVVHVLPWGHTELFREGRETVARLVGFMLEQPPTLENLAEPGVERTVA